MQIPDLLVVQLLKNAGKLDDQQFEQLKSDLKKQKRPVQYLAIADGLVTEEELAALYAADLGIAFASLQAEDISPDHLLQIPEASARHLHAVVFSEQDGRLQVATTDPANPEVTSFLQKLLGDDFDLFLTTPTALADALERYRDASNDQLPAAMEVRPVHQAGDSKHNDMVGRTFLALLQQALDMGASDIHIEPHEHVATIRFRVDGQLRAGPKLPLQAATSLATYCKSEAGLQPNESHAPQNGTLTIELGKQTLAVSVTTVPVLDGEKLTLHLENQAASTPTLSELGLWGEALMTVQSTLAQPQGLVLVVGPASSGKSNTLYSLLELQAKPSSNISTLQERITHRIRGANQTQVRSEAGLSYAQGLRALLRQDPDVILADNLPDNESVQLAIQAALDGRLVLSGMSLSDPIQAILRLQTTAAEPYLLAQAVSLIIGERRVRALCQHCRESYTPSPTLLKKLDQALQTNLADNMQSIHRLERAAQKAKLGDAVSANELGSNLNEILQLWRVRTGGCEECKQQGYQGQIGLFEVLRPSDQLRQLITEQAGRQQLTTQARADGTISWQRDGLIKALRGLVSIEDVLAA